jgi:hypothetical protein
MDEKKKEYKEGPEEIYAGVEVVWCMNFQFHTQFPNTIISKGCNEERTQRECLPEQL